MNKGIKIGIALEGGGAKGAYQSGVLKALKELGINYKCVVGTSIGALNATSYVTSDCDANMELWKNINFSYGNKNNKSNSNNSSNTFNNILDNIDEFEKYYMNSDLNDRIDPEPIIKYFKEIVDEDNIRKSNIEFGLTTYCLTDRKPLQLFIEDIPYGMLHEFIFASCCLPIFKPRPINGKYYLDGSFFSRLPMDMLVEKNCDVIIAVRLRPDKYNFEKYSYKKIIDISPDEYLGSTLEASKDQIVWMIEKGYNDTINKLKNTAV